VRDQLIESAHDRRAASLLCKRVWVRLLSEAPLEPPTIETQ
jgi:hypothetical protein